MVRLIKRYESRKLYDTEESRYVSLDEIAAFVRGGQEVRVIDNSSSEDVTAQTLTLIILEEGKAGRSVLPSELMHELLRSGERAFSTGVEQVQLGVDKVVQASIDRVGPLRRAREEMGVLRTRLEGLEDSLRHLEVAAPAQKSKKTTAKAKKAPKKAAKKPTKRVVRKAKPRKTAAARKATARSRASKSKS